MKVSLTWTGRDISDARKDLSPIQLGGMSIGDQWTLLDAYFDNGCNFIDTGHCHAIVSYCHIERKCYMQFVVDTLKTATQ